MDKQADSRLSSNDITLYNIQQDLPCPSFIISCPSRGPL